jgi:hypothetical protein
LIEIPPITPPVIEHRLHRWDDDCCFTGAWGALLLEMDVSRDGPGLSALIGRWVMVTPLGTLCLQGLSRAAIAMQACCLLHDAP